MARWYALWQDRILGPVIEAERRPAALLVAVRRYGEGVRVQSVPDYECMVEEDRALARNRRLRIAEEGEEDECT